MVVFFFLVNIWAGDKINPLAWVFKTDLQANTRVGSGGHLRVHALRPRSLGQLQPLAALSVKNTSKGFFSHVDLWLVCCKARWEMAGSGVGGRKGGRWA